MTSPQHTLIADFAPQTSDYVPKNILVTGGAGFIGGQAVLLLVQKYPNYKIVNLDKIDYCSCPFVLEEIKDAPNYKFVKGNILSPDLVNYVLEQEEIDTIIHFAAQTHVDNSFGNSFQFTQNNVMGTHVLLEAAKVHGIKRFIHVSTDEVYGEIDVSDDAAHEAASLEPTNPYAATKAAAEYLVKAYARSFKLPVIITRGNNVYGPGQYPEKLMPKFICLLEQGKKCYIHGDGKNTRTFVYVKDVARAFDTILHKGVTGGIYNVGSQHEISNLDVARVLIEKFKAIHPEVNYSEENFLEYVVDRPFNDKRYWINSNKLGELGWEPQMSWSEGIDATIAWYRENMNKGIWPNISSALVPHPRGPNSTPDLV
eukprot:TRINITY_DN1134_c0_g1_i1.p1 TRINITY_DN1134_c0_g1~~TRINITY_DN1134_c0_g1_i1.p1  ORF type:complete len:370 (-),score=80.72 TRINITY_DN1134_c0_g1_i1:580-1689(-)